jgi:hypothetical protein
MLTNHGRWVVAAAGALSLAACGGGGDASEIASTPTPPPAPPSPPPVAIKIFATPTEGEYASVGASIAGPGGNLDTYATADVRFGPISTSSVDQAHIRYTSGGLYEVKLAGADWDRLVPYGGISNSDPETNNYFQPQGVPTNYGYLITRSSRTIGYTFSELGAWGSEAQGRWGYVAFGLPTPAGAVPTSGSATFKGVVSGSTDVLLADNLYGGYYPLSTDGFVTLNFNFGSGSLGGQMDLFLPDGMSPTPLGSFTFRETVFSVGSRSYSGSFETTVAGQNFFLGQFTGPNAQETIGAWALPFVFNQNGEFISGDGQVHQAFGAWIAKREP